MPQRANVTSFEAIKTFRSNLIGYMTKARPALEEVSSEVTRTRLWLQGDRRSYWEGELRRRARKLEEADYIVCTKSFDGRLPKTEYRLTGAGRKALERYLNHMEALIRATREG